MSKCEKCVYRWKLSGRWCCEYILHADHPRGCEAGEGCNKFVPGNPIGAKDKKFGNIPNNKRRTKMAKIDKELLVQMIVEGKSTREMADTFGCSVAAVLEMKKTPKVQEMVQQIREAEYTAERTDEGTSAAVSEADMSDPLEKAPKLPIPPLSRAEWEESRRMELARAICEYAVEGLEIDPEWVAEYNERVAR